MTLIHYLLLGIITVFLSGVSGYLTYIGRHIQELKMRAMTEEKVRQLIADKLATVDIRQDATDDRLRYVDTKLDLLDSKLDRLLEIVLKIRQ